MGILCNPFSEQETAALQSRAKELADEIASQAKTAEDLNGLMR